MGQSGNAPLRLRFPAQPPSGLRCPHRTARAEARLCSATAAPAPSRFLRRRRRSTPQPLAGEAVKQLPPQKASPVRGGGIASAMTEGCGAWPRQYPSGSPQTFPALRHYRALRCGVCTRPQHCPSAALSGGRERPPYIAAGNGIRRGNGSQSPDPSAGRCNHRSLCRGALLFPVLLSVCPIL